MGCKMRVLVQPTVISSGFRTGGFWPRVARLCYATKRAVGAWAGSICGRLIESIDGRLWGGLLKPAPGAY